MELFELQTPLLKRIMSYWMMLRDYSCGFQLFFFLKELKQHFQTICFRQTAILNVLYVLIQCSIPSQGDPHKNI